MAITFVSAASAAADTLTMPTHQAGDLLIFAAHSRVASSVLITVPSGWLLRFRQGTTSRNSVVAWKTANSSSETSGTWTGAECVGCCVYRSNASKYLTVSSGRSTGTTGTAIGYQNIINPVGFNTWYFAFAGTSIDTTAQTPPSGFTNRTSVVNAGELAMHDTNGDVAGYGGGSVVCTSTALNTFVLEMYETDVAIYSAGGVPLIGAGGLVY